MSGCVASVKLPIGELSPGRSTRFQVHSGWPRIFRSSYAHAAGVHMRSTTSMPIRLLFFVDQHPRDTINVLRLTSPWATQEASQRRDKFIRLQDRQPLEPRLRNIQSLPQFMTERRWVNSSFEITVSETCDEPREEISSECSMLDFWQFSPRQSVEKVFLENDNRGRLNLILDVLLGLTRNNLFPIEAKYWKQYDYTCT